MGTDYVRPVAEAVASRGDVQRVGTRQLQQIEAEKARLSQQQLAIKSLMALYPAKDQPAHAQADLIPLERATVAEAAASEVNQNGSVELDQATKDKTMEVAIELLQRGLNPTPDDLIEALGRLGVILNVSSPRSVAGSYIFRARNRLQRAGSLPPQSHVGEEVT